MRNKVKIISHDPAFFELWEDEYAQAASPGDPQSPLYATGSASFDSEGDFSGTLEDPVGEGPLSPVPFLVRKYADRVLFLASSSCFFHCRFCFRRGSATGWGVNPGPEDIANAVRWISQRPEIEEVIISGGDPLTMDNEALGALFNTFATAPNIKRLRIHTKAPVVKPSRVDGGLGKALENSPLPVSVVLHMTHPAEIRSTFVEALKRLKSMTPGLFCQTVLLRGVNDRPATLSGLFSELDALGVKPRYLHHPDRAPGTGNFLLSVRRGLEIASSLSEDIGPLAPPYVIDLPDGSGKTPVAALTPHETEIREDMLRVRYRWARPVGWKGVESKRECLFWDIWETVRDSGASV